MKWITVQLMKFYLKRAKKRKEECDNPIVEVAYSNLISNFESTITFLKVLK